MGIYYIPPSLPYLETILEYISEKYHDDFSKPIIYLPNYKASRYLQELFLSRFSSKAIILPRVTTLYEPNFLYSANLSSNIFNSASQLEQELVLTNIIANYQKFNYSLAQSLSLSKDLAKLFQELIFNDVSFESLAELYSNDSAEHWMNIQEFLAYAKNEWNSYLKQHNKFDLAEQRKYLIEDKIKYLEHDPLIELIIAGYQAESPHLLKLYKAAAKSSKATLILPTINMELLADFEDKLDGSFSKINNILNDCELKFQDIKPLRIQKIILQAREKCLFNLFYLSKSSLKIPIEGLQNIKYICTVNQIEESALIAVIIKYLSIYEPKSRIVLFTYNKKLANQANIFLKRFNLEFARLYGENLRSSKAAEFLILLFNMVESRFEVRAMLSFMKHSYFYCAEVFQLEKKILRGVEIIGGESAILNKLHMLDDDKLYLWFSEFLAVVDPLIKLCETKRNNFKELLTTLIRVAENLKPDIWIQDTTALSEYLRDLIKYANLLDSIEKGGFITIFNKLLSEMTLERESNWHPNIFVASPNEVSLISNVDYAILADLNDHSWPQIPTTDPWMGDRMRTNLGLEKKSSQIINDLQNFYNALHCKNVILTRSAKVEGTQTIPSRFLLKLLSKLEAQNLSKYLEPEIDWLSIVKDVLFPLREDVRKKQDHYITELKYFPRSIAVTYLELLLRNPHGFYAKKILKLKKLEPIATEAGVREFGIFLHKVIEDYTSHYLSLGEDKYLAFLNIGKKFLNKSGISNFTKNLWWPKFKNIAKEFIVFDETKRQYAYNIHSEAQGIYKLNIGEHEISITAKADRIETHSNGSINIIDFKTGIIPTLKDIETGLSPQLLVEYLILTNGGFEQVKYFKDIKLSYIKLGSTKPYLKETTVNIKQGLDSFTKEGIIKLLEFFLKEDAYYLSCPNKKYAPNYNDYAHLAREE